MKHYRDQVEVHFLQSAKIHTSRYLAFRSIVLQDKEFVKHYGKLGLFKCSEHLKVVLLPNSTTTVRVYTCKLLPYRTACALLQPSGKPTLPAALEVTPAICLISG